MSWGSLIGTAVLALLSVGMMGMAIVSYRLATKLRRHGVRTVATVTGVEYIPSSADTTFGWYAKVRWQVDGRPYEQRIGSEEGEHKVGQGVTVVYLPTNPAEAVVDSPRLVSNQASVPLVLAFLLALGAGVFLVLGVLGVM